MITFDSPLERCPVCQEYVLLDSTQRECACEHHCPSDQKCPLMQFFEGQAFTPGAIGPRKDGQVSEASSQPAKN